MVIVIAFALVGVDKIEEIRDWQDWQHGQTGAKWCKMVHF